MNFWYLSSRILKVKREDHQMRKELTVMGTRADLLIKDTAPGDQI